MPLGDGASINAQLQLLANHGDWSRCSALLASFDPKTVFGDPSLSVLVWRGRLALVRKSPQAWIDLASAQRVSGHWASAADSLRCVLRLDSAHARGRLELARVCLAIGDPALALVLLESVRSKFDGLLFWSLYAQAIVHAHHDLDSAALTLGAVLPSHQSLSNPLCRQCCMLAGGLHLTGDLRTAQRWWLLLSALPTTQADGAFPRRPALIALLLADVQQCSPNSSQRGRWLTQLQSLQGQSLSADESDAWNRWLKDLVAEVSVSVFTGGRPFSSVLGSALSLFDSAWESLGEHALPQCEQRMQQTISLPPHARWPLRLALLKDLTVAATQTSRRSLLLLTHPSPELIKRALAAIVISLEKTRQGLSALASCLPSRALHQRPRRRWLFFACQQIPQCFLYRVTQKRQQLASLGCDSRLVLQDQLSDSQWTRHLLWADAVMVCRLPGVVPVLNAIEQAKIAGLPVFYDVDDLVFDDKFCPPPLHTYAGTLLPEQHRRFVLDVPLIAAAKQACDVTIVSTSTLAERSRALTPQQPVVVVPNLALPELCASRSEPALRQGAEPLRLVLASGSGAHKQIWREQLAPALAQLLERHTNLELLLLGAWQLPLVLLPYQDRIRSYPVSDYGTYVSRLGEGDVGVVPLEPGTFTDAKSAIRWMEFSYLGIPSVLSPSRTYTEILQEGAHACFAHDQQSWLDQLDRLIRDPVERHALALRAQRHAQRLFAPERSAQLWAPLLGGEQVPAQRSRLLVMSGCFAPFASDPIARLAEQHVLELQRIRQGEWEITVLCTDDSPEPAVATPAVVVHDWHGLHVVRVSANGAERGALEALYSEWLDADPFDLVHVHDLRQLTLLPLEVAHAHGIPYLISLHDTWWFSSSDRLFLLEAAAVRLTHARGFAAWLQEQGLPSYQDIALPWRPLALVPREIGPQQDRPLRCCVVVPLAESSLRLLRDAVQAASPVAPGLVLTLVEAGPLQQDQMSQYWGGTEVQRVSKAEWLDEAQGPGWHDQDVVLFPSLEPMGFRLEVVEALSAGLWVVVSDCGGLADPVRNGCNGDKITSQDPTAWTVILERLAAERPVAQPIVQFRQDQDKLRQAWHALYCQWTR